LETLILLKTACLFAHLLLSVFALQSVLSSDWRILFGQVNATQMTEAHWLLLRLLAGLWTTGLLLLVIDVGLDVSELLQRPKLLLKLTCVLILTANGLVLTAWCFPRLTRHQPLTWIEASAIMTCGAVSTCSWLMAAFIGVARPLGHYPFATLMSLYIAAIAGAVVIALLLRGRVYTLWTWFSSDALSPKPREFEPANPPRKSTTVVVP
jgi:hypothetical protein